MNKLATILLAVIIVLAFSFCSATKDISTENHPFKVTKATFNTWVGGQPGVRGVKVDIIIDNNEIQLDSLYFREMKSKLKKDSNANPPVFVGVFTYKNLKKDYILHENPEKEFGNTPINKSLNFPFSLKKNEAIISYLHKGKIHYYKIEELEEIKSRVKY